MCAQPWELWDTRKRGYTANVNPSPAYGRHAGVLGLGKDDSKSGKGSNYRRAHHHITAFWSAFMALCREECLKGSPTRGDRPVEDDEVVDGVIWWIAARVEAHKTFAVWKQFLLHDYPAYIASRTALRTGNFRLRLDALRRIAPNFCITGKDKYQFLVIDHLTEVSRYSRNDMRVVSELSSVSLGPDTIARIGSDERQEVANRLYKTLTKRVLSSTIEKLAPIAQLRQVAMLDFESHFVEKPRTERDRCRELSVKRAPAVRAAIDCSRESSAFKGDDGIIKVVALDGRVFPPVKWQEILNSGDKAAAQLRECVLYYVFKKKDLKGATKKKIFSIPARNSTNKATKNHGRSSARKDTVGNAHAGSGGVVTQYEMLEMVRSIGAATPNSMANATGGEGESVRILNEGKALSSRDFAPSRSSHTLNTRASECLSTCSVPPPHPHTPVEISHFNATGAKHAKKAAGPLIWVREHCADGFAVDPFYDADAHGVDLPVSIHQGVHPEYLEKGTAVIIDYFKKQLLSKWLKSTELPVARYDRQELVPAIKGHEQRGRTEKLGGCSRTFDLKSTDPVPSLQNGSWLRADGKAARDGIAANLAMRVLADDVWTADTKPNGIVASLASEALEAVPLLHFGDGTDLIPDVERHRGPDIGEAELPVIHFIDRAKKYWGKRFDKWVVSSVDTDLWMIILLAMTTNWLPPRGEGAVDLTAQRVVGGETKFLWMNRVFASICKLQDESDPRGHLTKAIRVATCNLQELGSHGRRQGWHVGECARLLATMFFYKDEAAFGSAHLSPSQLLESVDGDVEDYVSLVHYAILQLSKKKTTANCPSSFALRKHAERGNAIFRYWQNGLTEAMPTTEFAGKGWGVDPRGKGSDSDELTAENCVLWLSEYSYIGPDRKTATLACESARSLVAAEAVAPYVGRRRHPCEEGGGLRPSLRWLLLKLGRSRVSPDPNHPSLRVANAMALFIASMKQKESRGAEQSDMEAGTPESPASNDVSSGEAAESKKADLQDPESNENSDGSVGALDDLMKLDSGEPGSSDGESDGLSE
ncbi:unnamed protein product [Ectocarpus sp. CCAP 1310/34]|nr:unnamed protein product [Ectocarpus sp. CCAP 1310/34]